MDLIRQELDELMGVERNVPLQERKKKKEHYDDPEVCKHFLVSVCPHDLFPNTKCDLGVCSKRHDDIYKKMFLEDENRHSFEKQYINETISLIENLLHGVDSKIKKAQAKLDQAYATTEQPKELQEKLEAIDEEIKRLLSQVETLGDEGKIEESEACMVQVESLKKRKEEMKLTGDPNLGANRQMKVCEICGAMQALNDAEKRSQAHLEGKLHTGFAILRRELEQLKKRREELRNLALITKKEKEKERDREYNKSRGKDQQEHSEERHHPRRKRSSESRRDRKKNKSKSRSRSKRRSRSRDNKKSSRSYRDRRDRHHRGRSSSRSSSKSPSHGRKHKKSHKREKSRERKDSRNGENHENVQPGEEVPKCIFKVGKR